MGKVRLGTPGRYDARPVVRIRDEFKYGGRTILRNLVACCDYCNRCKLNQRKVKVPPVGKPTNPWRKPVTYSDVTRILALSSPLTKEGRDIKPGALRDQ